MEWASPLEAEVLLMVAFLVAPPFRLRFGEEKTVLVGVEPDSGNISTWLAAVARRVRAPNPPARSCVVGERLLETGESNGALFRLTRKLFRFGDDVPVPADGVRLRPLLRAPLNNWEWDEFLWWWWCLLLR